METTGESPFRRFGVALALMMGFTAAVYAAVVYGDAPRPQQIEGRIYYYQTQHSVEAPFYGYFVAHGGVDIFGYPITQKERDKNGLLVQYFQRARMEYYPQDQANPIHLGKLAEELGYGKPPLAPDQIPGDTPYQRYFPVTGHWSAYAFLDLYDRRGGEKIFGYPITEPTMENGRLVQYFQNARMEWWPERPPAQRVELTALGLLYANQHVPATWLAGIGNANPDDGPVATPVVTLLAAKASVSQPVIRQFEQQTVYVRVTDQAGNPVKGASVEITVNSNLAVHRHSGLPTNDKGIAGVSFQVDPDMPGQTVTIDVKVTFAGAVGATQTSYLVWY